MTVSLPYGLLLPEPPRPHSSGPSSIAWLAQPTEPGGLPAVVLPIARSAVATVRGD